MKLLDDATTIDQMRAALYKGSYDNALLHNTLTQARYTGLSGEDTYVLVAYHAMQQAIQAQRIINKYLLEMPAPLIIKKTDDKPTS